MRAAFVYLLQQSLWGGVTALAVLGIAAILRRAHTPSRWLCFLWLAVGVRFLAAPCIDLALPRPTAPALAQAADTMQTLAAPVPLPAGGGLPANAPEAVLPALSLWNLLLLVWAAGVLVLAVRAITGYIKLRRSVATACLDATAPHCYCGACVPTPMTLGILRPNIYLPSGLSAANRHAILAHENAHIRRRDTLTKPLFYAVACLHWFNPLAWLALAQYERCMESACDEAALQSLAACNRVQYGEIILQFALQGAQHGCTVPGSLAFGQGTVKKRVQHLLRHRKPGAVVLVLCAAAVGLCVTACMVKTTVAPEEAPAQGPATVQDVAPFEPNEPAADASAPMPEAVPTQAGAETQNAPLAASLFELSDYFSSPLTEYSHFSGTMSQAHNADDIAAKAGTPVYAVANGVVVAAEYDQSMGNYVRLSHGEVDGSTVQTFYAHLDSYTVEPGQQVKRGDAIGTVGSTGLSTGNHLHFEMQIGNVRVPPSYFTAYAGGDSYTLTQEMADELALQIAAAASENGEVAYLP